jgi:hypothetical protein
MKKRTFKLDLSRHFDPSKKAELPPKQKLQFGRVDDDALHDYDEVGNVARLGVAVGVDWDYLLARLDFTKAKFWLFKTENDESGDLRTRTTEVARGMVDDVLGDFVMFNDDKNQSRLQRVWLKRMFRERDKWTFRLGKDKRFEREIDEPAPPTRKSKSRDQLDLKL